MKEKIMYCIVYCVLCMFFSVECMEKALTVLQEVPECPIRGFYRHVNVLCDFHERGLQYIKSSCPQKFDADTVAIESKLMQLGVALGKELSLLVNNSNRSKDDMFWIGSHIYDRHGHALKTEERMALVQAVTRVWNKFKLEFTQRKNELRECIKKSPTYGGMFLEQDVRRLLEETSQLSYPVYLATVEEDVVLLPEREKKYVAQKKSRKMVLHVLNYGGDSLRGDRLTFLLAVKHMREKDANGKVSKFWPLKRMPKENVRSIAVFLSGPPFESRTLHCAYTPHDVREI